MIQLKDNPGSELPLPPTMRTVEHSGRSSRRSLVLYSVVFAMVQSLLLVAAVAIGCTHWFTRHEFDPRFAETAGYALRAKGVDCEILLYGDSTALVGLNPSIVQGRTGLKTCNIAEMGPIHWTVGSYFPLDEYLAHNRPPKFLLTTWSPYRFHPDPKPLSTFSPEGLQYAFLYRRNASLWRGLAARPLWVAWYAIWVERSLMNDALWRTHLRHLTQSRTERIPRDERAGFWSFDLPAATGCPPDLPPDESTLSDRRRFISEFRTRYTTPLTRVIVDSSPGNRCFPDQQRVENETAALSDNPVQFLPPNAFNNAGTHATPEASRRMSEEAAGQILALLSHQRAADTVHTQNSTVRGPAQK